MSEIEVNSRFLSRVGVHVKDSGGAGRPVVLIHGWPLSGESWKAQMLALRDAGFRAIASDRRRFGRSDKPGGGYDCDTLTDDLEGLMAELDLRDVTWSASRWAVAKLPDTSPSTARIGCVAQCLPTCSSPTTTQTDRSPRSTLQP